MERPSSKFWPILPLLQARKEGDGTFSYKFIMMDKSKAEMAAANAIGAEFLLCYFHFLQEAERFCRGSTSGVKSPEDRHAIIISLASLAKQRNEAIFNKEVRTQRHCVASMMLCCMFPRHYRYLSCRQQIF